MRPIKLTMSAFGPYAGKQVIDFEELNGRNIFVIAGKTGAGKTTIFDAISYALYGEASGESRENDSLRSHFADEEVETYVELEFEIRGERYLVNRSPKQLKKKTRGEGYTEKLPDAILTLPDGKIVPKVKAVNEKVIEILGINRDQFKQIVMLAQGEFKKLLLANSEDREKIFRKIFDTYDFEKIQYELSEKAKILRQRRSKSKILMEDKLKGIKGEHDITIDEYVDFPVVIEKLKELIERDKESYKNIIEEDNNLKTKIEAMIKEKMVIENNNKLIVEKEKIEKIVEDLLSKKEEFETKKSDIINGKNAKEVKHIEDKLIETKNKLEKRKNDYEVTLENIEKLTNDYKLSTENLKEEEAKEPQRDNLKVEIDKLKNIEPKIIAFDGLKNKNIELNQKVLQAKKQISESKSSSEKLKSEKIENENSLKEIANFETKKVQIRNDIDNKEKEITEMRLLYNVIREYEKSKAEHFNLNNEYNQFEKNYNEIKVKYETMDDSYKKEQAGILASKLEENSPCPVCGSTNHPNPATIKNNAYVPTKEELKIAKESLDKVESEKMQKINNLTIIHTKVKNYKETVDINLEKFSESLNIDKSYSKNSEEQVKSKGQEIRAIIDNLKVELLKLEEKIALKEKISNRNKEIEKNILENEKNLNLLEESEKQLLTEEAETKTKVETYKKEIPSDISDIQILKKLITTKTKELNESIHTLNKLRSENEKTAKNLQGQTSISKEINKSIKELDKEVNKVETKFESTMKKQGFENIEVYEESKEKIVSIERNEKQVEAYNSKLKLAIDKQEEISKKTKDLEIVDISNINEEIKNNQKEKKEKEQNLRLTYSILDNNKTILKQVEELNSTFKEMEEEYKVVGELADLANGKKAPYISFERYILASYFEDIIDAANIRLEKMTGDRFSLLRKQSKSKGHGQKGLELEIYDNYTDSSRDVSSLSGGESFKASLSLALGLSDVVQSNAGGVSLDTMFVDEGFGTLDPQSLDNAIDSLLELQRGGRLVGIISHVEELKERMDAKLEVVATSKGSKAEFVIL